MADTTAYKYVSNKNDNDGTTQVVVEGTVENPEKVLVRGGDPVELTDEQHEQLSERFNLRKASDKQLEQAEDTSGDPSKTEAAKDQAVRKTNAQTSATVNSGGGGAGNARGTADGSSSGGDVPASR